MSRAGSEHVVSIFAKKRPSLANSSGSGSGNSEKRDYLMRTRLPVFKTRIANKFCANKYMDLKRQNPFESDQEKLFQEAERLTLEAQSEIEKQAQEELATLFEATQDPIKFYKYFFEDLIPLKQEEEDNCIVEDGIFDRFERETVLQQMEERWRRSTYITLKLMTSNLRDDPAENRLWKWGVQTFARMSTPFGHNHVGLQIGPYIVDWNASELVIPRSFRSKSATMLIDISNLSSTKVRKNDENLMAICRKIVEWNCSYKYSVWDNDVRKRTGNCQFFVEAILGTLNIKASPFTSNNKGGGGGPISRYLKAVRDNAIGDTFKVWDHAGKEYLINTHEDLRNFHSQFLRQLGSSNSNNNNNNNDYSDEYIRETLALLKAIERAMQLRYMSEPDEAKRPQQYHIPPGKQIFLPMDRFEAAGGANNSNEEDDFDDEYYNHANNNNNAQYTNDCYAAAGGGGGGGIMATGLIQF